MNKFDSLGKKGSKQNAAKQRLEGCFSCQTCDELVESAELDDETLVWKCSQGHVSKIKGFEL